MVSFAGSSHGRLPPTHDLQMWDSSWNQVSLWQFLHHIAERLVCPALMNASPAVDLFGVTTSTTRPAAVERLAPAKTTSLDRICFRVVSLPLTQAAP